MTDEFWPGTTIPKSTHTGFTNGYGAPVDWSKFNLARVHQINSSRIQSEAAGAYGRKEPAKSAVKGKKSV